MGSVRLCAVQFMKHFALHLQAWFNNNLFTENKSIKNITNLEKSQLILKKKNNFFNVFKPNKSAKNYQFQESSSAIPNRFFAFSVTGQQTEHRKIPHLRFDDRHKYRTFQESVPANTLTHKKNIKRHLTTQILQRVSPRSGDLSENGLSLS